MILRVKAKTKTKDLVIEYIEAVLKNGRFVNLNWDYSEIYREEDGFEAIYRDVCFGEEKAKDCLSELEELAVVCVGLYSEGKGPLDISIESVEFEENYKPLAIDNINYDTQDGAKEVSGYVDLLRFTEKWLEQHRYDLRQYFVVDDPDEPAELGDLFDVAYDMKGDIEKSDFNPHPCSGKDYDYWYDGLVADKLLPILKSIAYENKMGVSE